MAQSPLTDSVNKSYPKREYDHGSRVVAHSRGVESSRPRTIGVADQ
jgi:hypothetical protein